MIRLSIRRPVTITMLYVVLTALGIAAWNKIPVEQLPSTNLPSLTVGASWGRTSAEVVEAFLTAPLEAEIQQIHGVDRVTSRSNEGSSSISVTFRKGTDMQFARIELLERITAMRDRLPQGIQRPSVSQLPPSELRDANQTLLSYRVTGPYILEAMREQLDKVMVPALQAIEGVAGVSVSGGARRMIRIDLDEEKILAYGLTPSRVTSAIQDLEVIREVGAVQEQGLQRTLVVRETIDSIPNIMDLVVLGDDRRTIRVSDIGTVHDTFEEPTSYARVDGHPSLTFDIVQQARVNTVDLADTVKSEVARVTQLLLPGMEVKMMRDQSVIIRTQLTELRNRALVAAVAIFAVLLLFLQSFRPTIIIFSTIAFATLITLNLMYFVGHTLNVLTLTGLAMGFGMVVDNAIVVLENVMRRWRLGEAPHVAAEKGSSEVVVAIMAATMTTIVVFIPFLYMQGTLRAYYLPLVAVIGFSLLASQFVAFSFIPALATKLLAARGRSGTSDSQQLIAEPGHVPPSKTPDLRGRPKYVRLYAGFLALIMRFPWVAVVIAVAMLGASSNLFNSFVSRGTIWNPSSTQRTYVNLTIRMPNGEELEKTDALARYFEEHLRSIPEVEEFVSRVSSTSASIQVSFPDSLEYTYAPYMVYEDLASVGLSFSGPAFSVSGTGKYFSQGGGIGSSGSQRIRILGYNFEEVRRIADRLADRLKQEPRVLNVDPNGGGYTGMFTGRATEIVVTFDRQRLGLYGVTVAEAAGQVSASTRGTASQASLKIRGEQLAFGAKIAGYKYQSMDKLQDLGIQGANRSQAVRLRDVAMVYDRPTLVGIARENQQYTRSVSYEFRGPPKLADKVRREVVAETSVPEGYKVLADSERTISRSEQRQIWGVLALSIVLVFMVTAMLFESLRQPLCVLLTVPMALIGVFLMFFYIGAPFNREAYIGVIIMGGIVVNNSILLIDRINRLRRNEGWGLKAAIMQGTLDRVRPILMTTTVTIIGLLPLVLFQENVNRNIWNSLAYALMGGLTSSTFLVLSVTPALYLLFETRPERRRVRRLKAEAAAAVPAGLAGN
jgi:HAE1 family hydrophobic/amphiphilic exporter-1